MKKTASTVFAIALLYCIPLSASVLFLPTSEESVGSSGSSTSSCPRDGYKYTTCKGALVDPCPSNENYYKVCCPDGYIHRREECVANISANSCHGYYKCDLEDPLIEARCRAEGYTFTAPNNPCPPDEENVTYTIEKCPYNKKYLQCVTVSSYQSCSSLGYTISANQPNPCPNVYLSTYEYNTYIPELCPQDSNYVKCIYTGTTRLVRPTTIVDIEENYNDTANTITAGSDEEAVSGELPGLENLDSEFFQFNPKP